MTSQASLAQSITHCRISMLSQFGGIFDAFASNVFLNASQFSSMHFTLRVSLTHHPPGIHHASIPRHSLQRRRCSTYLSYA